MKKRAWHTVAAGHAAQMRARIRADANGEVYNENYVIRISGRISQLTKEGNFYFNISIICIVILFAALISDGAVFLFFNISSQNILNIKELVVAFSSITYMFSMFYYFQKTDLASSIAAYAAEKIPDGVREDWLQQWNMDKTNFKIAYDKTEHQIETPIAAISHMISLLWIFFAFIFLLLLILGVKGYLFYEAFTNPSLSKEISYSVLSFAVLCEVAGLFLMVWKHIPVPFVDYGPLYELDELKKNDPDAYEQRIKALVHEDMQRKKKSKKIKTIFVISLGYVCLRLFTDGFDATDGISIEEFSLVGVNLFHGFLFGIAFFVVDAIFSRRSGS